MENIRFLKNIFEAPLKSTRACKIIFFTKMKNLTQDFQMRLHACNLDTKIIKTEEFDFGQNTVIFIISVGIKKSRVN